MYIARILPLSIITLILLVYCASAQSPNLRLALLIGNKDYESNVGKLTNPHNDIELLSGALREQGYLVMPLVKNGTRLQIDTAVREFVRQLRGGGKNTTGFFYYSGHGAAELETGINYIIPVDASDPNSTTFWGESLQFDQIISLLNLANESQKIVVFDACRNELQLPDKVASKGFVAVNEITDVFIAYAAAPNRPASDRGVGSGPYARALATHIKAAQGIDHLELFARVKEEVFASTNQKQRPWESNGLITRVYFGTKLPGSKPNELPIPIALIGSETEPEIETRSTGLSRSEVSARADEAYYGSYGSKRDLSLAFLLSGKAARLGDVDSQARLGTFYIDGRNVNKDPERGIKLIENALERGSAEAYGYLAAQYHSARAVARDDARAVALAKEGAARGSRYAMNTLASYYDEGVGGLPRDEHQALFWWRRAAEKGFARAKGSVGNYYKLGKGGLAKDPVRAARLFRETADEGCPCGKRQLALMYLKGDGSLQKDENLAIKLLEEAIDDNEGSAMVELGLLYAYGKAGLTKDEDKAVQLYKRAADLGNIPGKRALGYMYEVGRGGLPKSSQDALRLYEEAASYNDSTALNNIAVFYRDGKTGLVKNEARAVELFIRSAELGSTHGMRNLALMYKDGRGGLQVDNGRALQLFHEASELDDAAAHYWLGHFYEEGLGLPKKDEAMALNFYKKAAEGGEGWGQFEIGHFYFDGKGGLKKNYDKAKQSYEKAIQFNVYDACPWFAIAVQNESARGARVKGEDIAKSVEYMIVALKRGDEIAYEQITKQWDGWSEAFRETFQSALKSAGQYTGRTSGAFDPRQSDAIKALYKSDLNARPQK